MKHSSPIKSSSGKARRDFKWDEGGDSCFADWIPPWIDGETLYSWCCRYHRAAGARKATLTCQRLFGHPRAGLAHDVPGHMATFLRTTRGALGSEREILLTHTVLGYYLHTCPPVVSDAVIQGLSEESPQALKSCLGWMATRFGAAHPLKACTACCAEDMRNHCWSTWQLVHQLPGVWLCPIHGEALWTTDLKSVRHARFTWLLPDEIPETNRWVVASPDWPVEAIRMAQAVATTSQAWLASAPLASVDPRVIGHHLLNGLVELGFAATSGRLYATQLGSAYAKDMRVFQHFPEAAALCIKDSAAQTRWRRLIQSTRSLHPLHYIVAQAWLGRTERRGSRTPRSPTEADGQRDQHRDGRQVRRDEFLATLRAISCSVSAAAKAAGVSVGAGLVWASSAGVEVQRRPKCLSDKVRLAIQTALADGQPKQSIARRYHLSLATISRVLRSTPGLRTVREQRVQEMRRALARRQLTALAQRYPHMGIKELRSRCPAACTWLYRHDREWLRTFIASLPAPLHQPPPRVDWDARDRSLSRAVKSVVSQLAPSPYATDLRDALIRTIPGFKGALRKLQRLPRTRAALGLAESLPAAQPSK